MDFVVHSPSLHYSESGKLVEILVRDTVVALMTNSKSRESFYLIKIAVRRKRRWKMWRMGSVTLSRKG